MTSDSGKRHLEDVSKNKISSSRILVVDDEPGVVHLMQYGLKDFFTHGEVVIAMSGHEALELLEQRPFDLLIVDYMMPDMNGLVLAAEVKKQYPQIPIIMITAYHKPELDVLAARVSIYCVMRKPMSRTKLYEAIQNALR